MIHNVHRKVAGVPDQISAYRVETTNLEIGVWKVAALLMGIYFAFLIISLRAVVIILI